MISPDAAAVQLSVCRKTVYRLIAAGKLDARRLGRRVLIPIESLQAFVAGLPNA
jgi:excisionase family DNA binding protein